MWLPPPAEQEAAEVAAEVAARDALVWRIHTSLPTIYDRADFISAIDVVLTTAESQLFSEFPLRTPGQTHKMLVSELLNSHKKTVEPYLSWSFHLSHAQKHNRRRPRAPKARKVDFDLVSIPETAAGVYED